jgi:enoyl-[acyl-carrier protein] reductase I
MSMQIDMHGKKALVMGVTNKRSLGWAIASGLLEAGADVAFSYQGERLRQDLERLTADIPDTLLYQCDVTREDELKALFAGLRERWGGLDALVHAIAFAPREALVGRYLDTSRDDWVSALEISTYSLVAIAREAENLLNEGAGMVTLTYHASERVVPRYNVMAIAKSALEASVRYLAYELGPRGVRVNAVSAGPVRTVAARSIPGFMTLFKQFAEVAPLGRAITHEEVGRLGTFLASPAASGITGEVVYVDAGFHIMGMSPGTQEPASR